MIVMGMACAVITPSLANVLPVYDNNPIRLLNLPINSGQAIERAPHVNPQQILNASWVNYPWVEANDKPSAEIYKLPPQTYPVVTDDSPSLYCQLSSEALWPVTPACDDFSYQEVDFAKSCCYFTTAIEIPDSLNLRFWKSLTDDGKWDTLMDKAIGQPLVPEPAPVGFLGMSILGIASLQQLNNKKGK